MRKELTSDYDKSIDALFEGLSGACWILQVGRVDLFGVALTERVKERLIERHGTAASFIVYNTGDYEQTPVGSPHVPPRPGFFERVRAVFRPAPKPVAMPMPRWATLIREREMEEARGYTVLDRILGRHAH